MPVDGSFHLSVPANAPLQLQVIDERGLALRSCGWIWARNHQAQGCIGCHEDPERTPHNRVPEALKAATVDVTKPAARVLDVGFEHDLAPRLAGQCGGCHAKGGSAPDLSAPAAEAYARLFGKTGDVETGAVKPGRARVSPLAWHLLGANTACAWDGAAASKPARPISEEARKSIGDEGVRAWLRWIDAGAPREAPPSRPSAGAKPG